MCVCRCCCCCCCPLLNARISKFDKIQHEAATTSKAATKTTSGGLANWRFASHEARRKALAKNVPARRAVCNREQRVDSMCGCACVSVCVSGCVWVRVLKATTMREVRHADKVPLWSRFKGFVKTAAATKNVPQECSPPSNEARLATLTIKTQMRQQRQ